MSWPADIEWDGINRGQMSSAAAAMMKAVNQRRAAIALTLVDFPYNDGGTKGIKNYPTESDLSGIPFFSNIGTTPNKIKFRDVLLAIQEAVTDLIPAFDETWGGTPYTTTSMWAAVGLGEPPTESELNIMAASDWKRLKDALDLMLYGRRTWARTLTTDGALEIDEIVENEGPPIGLPPDVTDRVEDAWDTLTVYDTVTRGYVGATVVFLDAENIIGPSPDYDRLSVVTSRHIKRPLAGFSIDLTRFSGDIKADITIGVDAYNDPISAQTVTLNDSGGLVDLVEITDTSSKTIEDVFLNDGEINELTLEYEITDDSPFDGTTYLGVIGSSFYATNCGSFRAHMGDIVYLYVDMTAELDDQS